MGKGARRRRRQQRRRRRKEQSQALARVDRGVCLYLRVQQLELARGHDGLLRGMPEPTLVLGVYRIDGSHTHLVGRYLYRFERPRGFPTKVAPREKSYESLVVVPSGSTRLLLLLLAVEEDSGRGLQTLYTLLEDGDAVVAWTEHEAAPVPTHLPELSAGMLAADVGHRIHLMFGDRDPSVCLSGDDWVDANLVWTSISFKRTMHRLRFVSPDERNDWTAEIDVAVRLA